MNMKMPVDNVLTTNPNNCHCVDAAVPMPKRTIKDNVDETEKLLCDTIGALDRLIEFIWFENNATPPSIIDVHDLDSATSNNRNMAQAIHDRVLMVCDHIGLAQ